MADRKLLVWPASAVLRSLGRVSLEKIGTAICLMVLGRHAAYGTQSNYPVDHRFATLQTQAMKSTYVSLECALLWLSDRLRRHLRPLSSYLFYHSDGQEELKENVPNKGHRYEIVREDEYGDDPSLEPPHHIG